MPRIGVLGFISKFLGKDLKILGNGQKLEEGDLGIKESSLE